MDRNNHLVIVLSRNYSNGLAVIRSLGNAGYTVDLIANMHKEGAMDIAAASKYVRNVVKVVSEKITDDGKDPDLLAAIMEYAGKNEEKPLLFPTDDYTCTIMDTNRDQLEEYFLMPGITGGKQGELAGLMDKTVQERMAREVGLLTPYTTKVSLKDEQIDIPDDVVYPCYVKPLKSIEGYKTEMAVCLDEDELEEHLEFLRDNYANREVIVQEYLEIEQEYASAGVCLDQEVILPAMIKKSRIGVHGRGVTLTGELVPTDVLGSDVVEKAYKLLRSFHNTGNFGMEFNLAGGKLYFNEVNLRSAGESYSYFKSGANFPAIFADERFGIQSIKAEDVPFDGIGKTLMYDKIAWEDYIYGFITRAELDKCIEETDIKVLVDEDDPAPGEKFVKEREKQNRIRSLIQQRRRECIMLAAIDRGIEEEEAAADLDRTRELTHITYKDYLRYKFWKVKIDEQIPRYEKILEHRELRTHKGRKSKPVAVVLSRTNTKALSAARALGESEYPVDLIGVAKKKGGTNLMGLTKYARLHSEIVAKHAGDGRDENVLLELLDYKTKGKRKVVFIPADEMAFNVMNVNQEALEGIFYMPHTDAEVQLEEGQTKLDWLSDHAVHRQIAEEVGIDVRKQWTIDLREDTLVIPEELKCPCYCRVTEYTISIRKEHRVIETREQLEEHLAFLKDKMPEREAILSEYTENDAYINIAGVCADQTVVAPAFIKLEPSGEGTTLMGKVEPISKLGETGDKIVQMLQKLHYTGPFVMTLNVIGDRLMFSTLDFYLSTYDFAYYRSGINIPVMTERVLIGKPPVPPKKTLKPVFGKTVVGERSLWEDYGLRYISKEELDEKLAAADIKLIEYAEDPEPGDHFKNTFAAAAERKRKRIKKRKREKKLRAMARPVLLHPVRRFKGYPQEKFSNSRKLDSDTPRVLIAGRNWMSNLCMAKSVGEAGYKAEVLHVFPRNPKKNNIQRWLRPEKYSNYVHAYYALNEKKKERRIVQRLLNIADPDKKMLLIPADDLVGSTIDEYYYDLKDHYIMPTVNGEGGHICKLMSKDIQKELARKAGLPVLNDCVITSEGDEIVIPDTVNYPCFIKPNISKNGLKTKMMRCDSEEQLRLVLQSRKSQGFEMLVEDYVEINRELSYLGLSTEDGVVCPGYFEAVIEGEGSHRGVALMGRLLPTEEAEPLLSDVVKFIESLHYTGLFDVDLIEDKNGKIYFVELNLRYGGSGFALTRAGVNLPGMYCDYMLKGKPIDLNISIDKAGQTFVSEKVLINEFREGLIDYEEIDEIMDMADIYFTKDKADMKPYRHLKKNFKVASRLREETKQAEARKEARRAERRRLAEEEVERQLEERRQQQEGNIQERESQTE